MSELKIMQQAFRKLATQPLFLFGLLIRLALIFSLSTPAAVTWYLPFLESSLSTFKLDPWQQWLAQQGNSVAFPYGYVMWLTLMPFTALSKLLGIPLAIGYGFTLLTADIFLLVMLRELFAKRDKLLLITYWLSPIVLLASYVLGYNDLIPVLLLIISVYFTRQLKLVYAGIFLTMAISAKLSMVLALPFFFIYQLHNRALRQLFMQFIKGLTIGFIVFGLPFLFSSSGLHMLFSNPEMGKIYQLTLTIGDSTSLFIVPLAYLVAIYTVWRVKRLNFELFLSTLGLTFLLVVLLTPASPGWFIWALPLLVAYQNKGDPVAILLCSVFSLLYIAATLLAVDSNPLLQQLLQAMPSILNIGSHSLSLLHTAMIAIGVILTTRIWHETISKNDYFRLSRKPFVIGIAGDSGAGKDTYSDAIKGLFGSHSVASLMGDDYHLWDRHKPMWQAMTHLNPMANDLEKFSDDLLALSDGKSIFPRHYDHTTGKMSKPGKIKSNDFIIANGLHALYHPILRECYNLSVYLDMDDDLRRYFKIQRDVNERGHSMEKVLTSFIKREMDAEKFIHPQAEYADLLLSIKPIHPRILDNVNSKTPLRLKLLARSRNGLSEMSLTRVLIGVCGLHVDMTTRNENGEVELCIEGDTCADDIALAAKMLCPRILEFADIKPKWQDGMLGLMQLITLSHINQALTKRFV